MVSALSFSDSIKDAYKVIKLKVCFPSLTNCDNIVKHKPLNAKLISV